MEMGEILTATQTNMNLLISTIRAANALCCQVIFTRTKGYFIPKDPLWHSRDIKILRAGSSFQQEHDRAAGTGYDGMREGYDITGTIVTASLPSSFFAGETDSPLGIYGSYVMPQGLGSDYALVDEAELPSWLDTTQMLEVTTDGHEDTLPIESVGPVLAACPEEAKPPPKTGASSLRLFDVRKIAEEYAFFNTMVKNLGSNTLSVVTALRDDIVPGSNIGIDTKTADGETFTLYGQVTEVTNVISVAKLSAITVLKLRYVRSSVEQKIIDDRDRGHFAWKNAADTINALRLWS